MMYAALLRRLKHTYSPQKLYWFAQELILCREFEDHSYDEIIICLETFLQLL